MACLIHEGTPHEGGIPHSGRWPWGSGDRPFQTAVDYLSHVGRLRQQGLSDDDIAKGDGFKSLSEFKRAYSAAVNQQKVAQIYRAKALKEKGYSNTKIGEELGVGESTIRNYLDEAYQARNLQLENTKAALLKEVQEYKYIDVGHGIESHMGITRSKLDTAVADLVGSGECDRLYLEVPQAGTGLNTSIRMLVPAGTSYKEAKENLSKLHMPLCRTEDGGLTEFDQPEPPKSVSSSRVQIVYAEDGGKDKDGVIELRRGVEDISLGKAQYAQVRIAVDDTHYLKGMAVYADDLPEGVDIRFNTNKHVGTPMLGPKDNTVLKPMKKDPENPFGASIIDSDEDLVLCQRHYTDENGERQLSSINVVNEQGEWGGWSKTLSAQFLSKQTPYLAKKQLDVALDQHKAEYDDINAITNPVIKAKFMQEFADECDSDAVHLKAAGLPGQRTHVILPVSSLKDNEIYAPNYDDGEEVICIRYPHAGIFEIPRLTVNNRNKEARAMMEQATDAVGINAHIAGILSGADFDGDTVLVIPLRNGLDKVVKSSVDREVATSKAVDELRNFDPKEAYPKYPGMKVMSEQYKQKQMGIVSNLITDMQVKNAPLEDIVKAVKHSMVVIDAAKHELNWKQSEKDNDIARLKKIYQTDPETGKAGASTVISKAKSPVDVLQRKMYYDIDPETGRKIIKETGDEYRIYSVPTTTYTKTGKEKVKMVNGTYSQLKKRGFTDEEIRGASFVTKPRMQKSTKGYETEDLSTLVSKATRMEEVYIGYGNALKALGNQARLSVLDTENETYYYSSSAAQSYAKQVGSLEAKLRQADLNKPYERKAQTLANEKIKMIMADDTMDDDKKKKEKNRALSVARRRVGAKKTKIYIDDDEWEAIQNGAVKKTLLRDVCKNADTDRLRSLATPKQRNGLSAAQESFARSLLARGYTQNEVASQLGVSVNLVSEVATGSGTSN